MEIKALREERGYVLIANFDKGFASGWKMAVRSSFKEALDIKLTPRISGGKKEMLWTQGNSYNFREGDTIHNIREAYSDWNEALKKIDLSIQVERASPSSYTTYESIIINQEEVEVSRQKSSGSVKIEVANNLSIKKQRVTHGFVRFRVYRPNKNRTALEKNEYLDCTQDDFIAFLQTGIIRTKNNKLLNLLELS